MSDDGNHIRHGAAPSLPEKYVQAIDGAPIGPKNGSCGAAMYRGKPVAAGREQDSRIGRRNKAATGRRTVSK